MCRCLRFVTLTSTADRGRAITPAKVVSAPPDDDEPVPRIPRGRGMKLDGAMIARIGMTLALLIMIIVTAKPCANATSKFVTGFGEEGSAAPPEMPKPGNVDVPSEIGSAGDYESMSGTDADRKAAFERAKAKAAARDAARAGSAAGSGSAGSASAGSGSAGSGSVGSSMP